MRRKIKRTEKEEEEGLALGSRRKKEAEGDEREGNKGGKMVGNFRKEQR